MRGCIGTFGTTVWQTSTLNLVGVTHLFVIPRLRTSRYIRMLSDAFPELRTSSPGNIQVPALPSLRNLVVVDNIYDAVELQEETRDVKSIIDWKEILIWREDALEQRHVDALTRSQRSDDVINLQFTRWVSCRYAFVFSLVLCSGTTGAPKAVSVKDFLLLCLPTPEHHPSLHIRAF